MITIEMPTWIFYVWMIAMTIDIGLQIYNARLRKKYIKLRELEEKADEEV